MYLYSYPVGGCISLRNSSLFCIYVAYPPGVFFLLELPDSVVDESWLLNIRNRDRGWIIGTM
jgi:hypothetical protein